MVKSVVMTGNEGGCGGGVTAVAIPGFGLVRTVS